MNILLAEDDTFFQSFYSTKLTEQGFIVDSAHNGEEALQILSQKNPDVILLDLIMPKMDGFEVLRAISENDSLKKAPVIVFSTLGQEQDIEKAKQLGATEYVNKTFFDFDNLLKKILAVAKN